MVSFNPEIQNLNISFTDREQKYLGGNCILGFSVFLSLH